MYGLASKGAQLYFSSNLQLHSYLSQCVSQTCRRRGTKSEAGYLTDGLYSSTNTSQQCDALLLYILLGISLVKLIPAKKKISLDTSPTKRPRKTHFFMSEMNAPTYFTICAIYQIEDFVFEPVLKKWISA